MEDKDDIKGKYRHFKGNEYEVIGLGTHTETGEKFVLYTALLDSARIWIRPYSMFFEMVVVDGTEIRRFRIIEE